MKNIIYLFGLTIVLWSCGGGGTEPDPDNNAPTTPTQTYPLNDDLCIDNSVTFTWGASTDADQDAITYVLNVSTNSAFSSIEHTKTVTSTSTIISLDKGVAYYWRILAKDSEDSSSYSATKRFYTEGVGVSNYLPFAPEVVSPINGGTVSGTTATLQWTASDVDTGDTLTYDVFLKQSNDIDVSTDTPVSADQSTNTYDATGLSSATNYWLVVVKDDNGGEVVGQTWSFVTD